MSPTGINTLDEPGTVEDGRTLADAEALGESDGAGIGVGLLSATPAPPLSPCLGAKTTYAAPTTKSTTAKIVNRLPRRCLRARTSGFSTGSVPATAPSSAACDC